MENLLTTNEAAAILSCHPQTLYRNREIPRLDIPGIGIRYKQEEIEKLLEELTPKPGHNITQAIENKKDNYIFSPDFDILISNKSGGKSEMPKGKNKTRYNFDYGAIYVRKTRKGIPRYYLEYYDLWGKRKQVLEKTATTWEEAQAALKNVVLQEHAKKHGLQSEKKKIRFREFGKVYLESYIKVNISKWETEKGRLNRLVEFFNDIELREITPLMIEKFRDSRLKAGNTKSTTNRYIALLKRMFTVAIGEGYLEENIVKRIKLFSEKNTLKQRILLDEEEERLLQHSAEHLRAFLIVCLNTGMRAGEIFKLQWNQVDLKARRIRVEHTKSGRMRYIDINTPLFEALLKIKNAKTTKSLFVFTNPKTERPFTSMKTAFLAACRRAEIEGLRMHDLRHTFASRLISQGTDIETARELLGHHSVTLTQRYTHSNADSKKKAVELLAKKEAESPQKEDFLLHRRYTSKKKSTQEEKRESLNHLISWN